METARPFFQVTPVVLRIGLLHADPKELQAVLQRATVNDRWQIHDEVFAAMATALTPEDAERINRHACVAVEAVVRCGLRHDIKIGRPLE